MVGGGYAGVWCDAVDAVHGVMCVAWWYGGMVQGGTGGAAWPGCVCGGSVCVVCVCV